MSKINSNTLKPASQIWFVYILECRDASLYTGITNNLEKRIAAHNNGTGAKYTKGRGPVRIIYQEQFDDKSAASKREYAIKQMRRNDKIKLIYAK